MARPRKKLDDMSEVDKQLDILLTLQEMRDQGEDPVLRLVGRSAAEFWLKAVNMLEKTGQVTVNLQENHTAQESWLEIKPVEYW